MKTPSIKYFLYVRKSTDDKKHQVLSLPAQMTEMNELCKREGLEICETLTESRTAKVPGRPIFNEMLDRIERGEANGILVWEIDRLYRNPIDEGRVRWLLQQGILASVHTFQRNYLPSDAGLLMAVEGGRATDHVLKWAVNLKRTHEAKLRLGVWPGSKILGYEWNENRRDFVPHPEKAKALLTFFEEFAEGRTGLEAGGARLASFGIAARSGKPFSKSAVRIVLTNRKYTGVMDWKGEVFQGKFTPIISTELFNQVQKVLSKRSKPRKVKRTHSFPFCGIFRCSCGAMITAQWAKGHGGIYRYYRCSRKAHQPCSEPYLQEKHVIAQCAELARPAALSATEAAELRAEVESTGKQELQSLVIAVQKIDEKLEPLEEQHRTLRRLALNGTFSEDEYRESKEELVLRQNELKQEKRRLQKTRENSWVEPARRLVNTLETLGKTPIAENLHEFSRVVQKIGTNHMISRKTVSFSFSEDYEFVPSLLASVRVSASQSESNSASQISRSSKWCALQDLNHPRHRSTRCNC
jgi:DNA invertase Pin-like site-specific DNA recombinase